MTKNIIRKSFLRDRMRSQIQAAEKDKADRQTPTVNVKKRPPKKAGPISGRLDATCLFGIERYPALLMAAVIL